MTALGAGAAPTMHRPSCMCGGTGLVDGAELEADGSTRRYRNLVPCPADPWPTPAPSSARSVRLGRKHLADARAELNRAGEGTTAAPAQLELEL